MTLPPRPPYNEKVITRFFHADTAAQSLTGVHLLFHGLVLTAIAQLYNPNSPQHMVLLKVFTFIGLFAAIIWVLREWRMQRFRAYWESAGKEDFARMREWINRPFPLRLARHSRLLLACLSIGMYLVIIAVIYSSL